MQENPARWRCRIPARTREPTVTPPFCASKRNVEQLYSNAKAPFIEVYSVTIDAVRQESMADTVNPDNCSVR